jgi:hypothetical protein
MIPLAAWGIAWAGGPPDAEHRYWQAQLLEAADGDLPGAIGIYDDLSRTLEGKSEFAELRARALLAKGRAHLTLGQLDPARQAFEACRRITTSGLAAVDTSACVHGARRVALEEGAFRVVPTTWTFDDGAHGFVLFSERGSTAVEGRPGKMSLVWSQDVDNQRAPELAASVRTDGRPVQTIRLTIRAEGRSVLELLVVDEQNRAYSLAGKVLMPDGKPRTLDIRLSDLEPLDPTWPPLDVQRVAWIRLRDATGATFPDQRGSHRIVLDEFTIL